MTFESPDGWNGDPYNDGYEDGAKYERAAIVNWLREQAMAQREYGDSLIRRQTLANVADILERKDHLK